MLTGPSLYNFPGQNPTDLIILLHGYGSNGADLLPMSRHFEDCFERPYFIAPNAPFRYEYAGSSYPNEWQWFSLADRSPPIMLRGVTQAREILDKFLNAKLNEFGLTNKNLYLVGFSQGTMTALHTAFRRVNEGCRCVIAISGTMIAPEILKDDIISKPPVCFVHGAKDDIVSLSLGMIAYKYTLQNGIKAEFHKLPEAKHHIDFTAIEHIKKFLKLIK